MSYFTFNQNNSGGEFIGPRSVIIEADSADEANARAHEYDVYFDGCSTGHDCPCCGDRWSRVYDNDATDKPEIYGVDPERHRSYDGSRAHYMIVNKQGIRYESTGNLSDWRKNFSPSLSQ